MNKYLSYDRQRAPKVREMFTRLAWRYDVVNDVMSFGLHRRWKRETVAIAAETGRSPARWLDLCCGTGDMCFLAEAAGGDATRVVGADFTLPMLAVARRRKLAERKSSAFAQADALQLPFPDGSFDAITVGYGLRNPAAAALYTAFLHTMMPAVGLLFHGDADTYLYIPASLKRYPGQRGVAELMRREGFANVRYEYRLRGTMGINVGEAP